MSQTGGMDRGGSKEIKIRLNVIGTGILVVCECPESVVDR